MDLKEMFGHRYVVTLDESWEAEKPEHRTEFEAKGNVWWYYEIKGKHGRVHPHSESRIGARLSRRIGKKALAALGQDLEILEDSIEAIGLRTDVRNIKMLLKLIKPTRRHQLSEERRQAMSAHMAAINSRKPKIIQENGTSGTLPGPISCEVISTPAGVL